MSERKSIGPGAMKVGLMMPQGDGMRGPGTRRWSDMAAMTRLAEDTGFDSVWVVDHWLYLLEGEERGDAAKAKVGAARTALLLQGMDAAASEEDAAADPASN